VAYYYPEPAEFLLLLFASFGLLGGAAWLFSRVTEARASLPVWIALLVSGVAFVSFLGVTVMLWQDAHGEWTAATAEYEAARAVAIESGAAMPEKPAARTLTLMLYAAAFWFVPATYYARQLSYAFSTRTVESIAALEQTENDSNMPFRHARILAMNGNIDGAIARYRAYTDGGREAKFEAAQLLESEGRFREALDFYIEIGDRYRKDARTWGEAMFRRARMLDTVYDDMDGARNLYERILDRAPETEFATLASTQLARLRPEPSTLLKKLDAGFEYDKPSERVISHIPRGGEFQGA
jgi:tetratricopeptide (TPR) repeat protein